LASDQRKDPGGGMRSVRRWLAALGVALLAGALVSLFWRDGAPPAPESSRPAPLPPAEEDLGARPDRLPAPEPSPPKPAGHPSDLSAPARPSGEEEKVSGETIPRAMVRQALEEAFDTHLPDRRLAPEQYERLTDAVLRIRAARRSLTGLPLSQENAEAIHRLREELTDALTDFHEVAGLTLDEFTELAQPGLGLDKGGAGDGTVVLETLPEPPPPE
jgi:hypothetical protein